MKKQIVKNKRTSQEEEGSPVQEKKPVLVISDEGLVEIQKLTSTITAGEKYNVVEYKSAFYSLIDILNKHIKQQ